jgi:AraC-like DNA-binding protein
MIYRTIDHSQDYLLSKYILDIYELKNIANSSIYECIPNGQIGISIITSGKSFYHQNSEWNEQPKISLYGMVRKIQSHKIDLNYRELNFGFKPQYLQLFMKTRLYELDNADATDLYLLFNKDLVTEFYESLLNARNDASIVKAGSKFLLQILKKETMDKRVLGTHQIIESTSLLNVSEISNKIGVSSSRLRALFKDQSGISLKGLLRIYRIYNSLDLKILKFDQLSDIAFQMGYYDQAHFNHDFKKSLGLTPSEYYSNDKRISDFYNYKRWEIDSFVSK